MPVSSMNLLFTALKIKPKTKHSTLENLVGYLTYAYREPKKNDKPSLKFLNPGTKL